MDRNKDGLISVAELNTLLFPDVAEVEEIQVGHVICDSICVSPKLSCVCGLFILPFLVVTETSGYFG